MPHLRRQETNGDLMRTRRALLQSRTQLRLRLGHGMDCERWLKANKRSSSPSREDMRERADAVVGENDLRQVESSMRVLERTIRKFNVRAKVIAPGLVIGS